MSIDSKPNKEETPVAPADNNKAKATVTHRRTKSIAEQIAQNWRDLPKDEQKRWTAATEAVEADSEFEPLHLHLDPRALLTDLELDIEQFPTEDRYPTDASIENTTAFFADDLLFLPVALPAEAPTNLPPWRRPGAFTGGLDNVSLITFLPLPPRYEEEDEDEEAKEAHYRALEVEEDFLAFKELIRAHCRAEAEADAEAEAEAAEAERAAATAKEGNRSPSQRPSSTRAKSPVPEGQIRGPRELRTHQRLSTSIDIPARRQRSWWR